MRIEEDHYLLEIHTFTKCIRVFKEIDVSNDRVQFSMEDLSSILSLTNST